MNLASSFIVGFLYGCAAILAVGVCACIVAGYAQARRSARLVRAHKQNCGIDYRGCPPDCRFEVEDKL